MIFSRRCVLSSLAILALSVQASLVFEEDFNSMSTGALNSQNPFTVNSGNQTYNVQTGGLSYSAGGVNHNGGGQHLNIVGGTNDNTAHAAFAEQTGDVYFSFLFERLSGSFLWMAVSNDTSFDGSGAIIGRDHTNGEYVRIRIRNDFDTGFAANTTSNDYGDDFPTFNESPPYLAVGKFSKSDPGGNYDTLQMVLNPASLTEPAIWDQSISANSGIDAVNTLLFRAGSAGADQFNVDMIRIGTSYDSVVIPEPGTLMLMGLGVVLLIYRRLGR